MAAAVSAVPGAYQGLGKRFVALAVDSVVLGVLGYVIAAFTGGTTSDGFSLNGLPAMLWFLVSFAYYILLEGLLGATVGKLVLGIRVVKADGSKCDIGAALIRNVLRIVDFLPFAYIVGIILIAASKQRQRVGDRVAGTVVVGRG
ncbi:MAG TPA: RDD family protein [Chloroflexota bacterium]